MARRSMARGAWVLLLATLLGACGDDGAGSAADGSIADRAGGDQAAGDRGLVVDRSGIEGGAGDRGLPRDQSWPFDLPPGSGSNSGALCSASKPCASSEEECLYFGSSTGMCLSRCAKKGDACKVADPNGQVSTCATKGLDPSLWYCAWFCLLGGQTHACPNATDYQCVPSGTDGFSFCRPK